MTAQLSLLGSETSSILAQLLSVTQQKVQRSTDSHRPPQTFLPSKLHQHPDQLGLRENQVGKELSLSPPKAVPAHTMLEKTAGLPQDTSVSVPQDKAL